MSKSLAAALASSLSRPLSVSASLSGWVGKTITLTNGKFWEEFLSVGTFTGKRVSVDQALQLSTVWACVRLIAETAATLPFPFYKKNPDGSRTPATTHPLYGILHDQPNADMTAVTFWCLVFASLLLWGNAYVEVRRNAVGNVIALLWLHPACVSMRRLSNGSYLYTYSEVTDTGSRTDREIPESGMMHIPAFSVNGRVGLSPVAYGANVLGSSIETDRASMETFKSTLRSPGVITTSEFYNETQREDLRKHVKKVQAEGGVMVIEKGSGFQTLSFKPVDAELLSSRGFNVEEMCRWFRIDPAMVGHGSKDSNWGTGLEQKMIWFLTFTLRHWCVRIEQAVRRSLLTPVERQTYYAEFALEGLLRADSAARAQFYSTMEQNGNMTRDEVRKLENLPPMGGNAAKLTIQSNMIMLEDLGKETGPGEQNVVRDALVAWLGLDQLVKEKVNEAHRTTSSTS